MREHFVRYRPGVSSLNRIQFLEDQIKRTKENIERIKDSGERFYDYQIKDNEQYIARWEAELEEQKAILSAADPDDHILQQRDYFEAAFNEYLISQNTYRCYITRQIETLVNDRRTEEARRIAVVYGQPMVDLYPALLSRIDDDIKSEVYIEALTFHDRKREEYFGKLAEKEYDTNA